MRFLKSFTNLVGVGLSVLLLIWFVEIMNHKNRATESFSSSETFSNKSVKVSSTVQYSTVQKILHNSTVQYSTVQYSSTASAKPEEQRSTGEAGRTAQRSTETTMPAKPATTAQRTVNYLSRRSRQSNL